MAFYLFEHLQAGLLQVASTTTLIRRPAPKGLGDVRARQITEL